MKRIKGFLVVLLLILGGTWVWLYPKYSVPIIMYHNVQSYARPNPNSVSPENFVRQMSYLKEHGFQVISLAELIEGIKAGRSFSRKNVVITFDDGYENNYQYGFAILKKFGYPATIFVISDLVGQAGYLTWEEIKEMQKFKIDVGGHTRRHAYLPDIPTEKQQDEIAGSKRILEENLGWTVSTMSYPSGGFNEQIKDIAKQAGYVGACTTNRGHERSNKDVYELKRIRLSDKDQADSYLWIKLSGYYNLFRQPKDPS